MTYKKNLRRLLLDADPLSSIKPGQAARSVAKDTTMRKQMNEKVFDEVSSGSALENAGVGRG